jgi:hypothetical protein
MIAKTCSVIVIFEIFRAVKIQIEVFRVVTPCRVYPEMKAARSSETSVPTTTLHGVKNQKTSPCLIIVCSSYITRFSKCVILYFAYVIGLDKSRDSSVGVALGYGLDDRGRRVRFPAGAGNFSLHHRVQNDSGVHPAYYSMGTSGFFPGGKAAGA